jgi:nitrogen-specific signal transduction histidine kinase
MSVDFSDILHVLAHELRTPIGIAHGYVRLLLEDRLPQDTDRRRALEQMHKALGRLGELSQESSALASWFEQAGTHYASVQSRAIVERVAAAHYEWPVKIDMTQVNGNGVLRTRDIDGLAQAIINLVRATARELRGSELVVVARDDEDMRLEILAGPHERVMALQAGPTAADASPIALERGGLGLALVHAAVVLDAHGADRWTINGSRETAGLRLPLERSRQ